MKSFIAGLIAIMALGLVGFYTFKATTKFMSNLTPTPSASPSASISPTPTPSTSAKPEVEDKAVNTTKGGLPIKTGLVKGVTSTNTSTKITTTTTKGRWGATHEHTEIEVDEPRSYFDQD